MTRSRWLVGAQIALIVLILSGRLGSAHAGEWRAAVFILVLAGLLLGVWALMAMRAHTFSVMPEPRAGGTLCKHGPYQWLRHPMYTAVLLVCVGACAWHALIWKWVLLGALLLVLVTKLRLEETLLAKAYPDYSAYRTQTSALLPGVF